MSVQFSEDHGSPTESVERGAFQATRRLRCAWSDRLRLAHLMTRGIGQPYPHWPSARARSAKISPVPAEQRGSGSRAAYEEAIVTVEYSTPGPGDVEDEDQHASERLRAAGEFLTMAVEDANGNPTLFWDKNASEPLSPQEAPGRVHRFLEYEVTRFEVDFLPDAAFDLIGKVNESAVTALLLNKVFDAETLLYTDLAPSRIITDEGAQRWDKAQSFIYNPKGWNRFWRSQDAEFKRMFNSDGEPRDPFETGDFTRL